MGIAKSIVGKLWMTIIALVAFVLLILGLFLFRYIDTSFPKYDDQLSDLEKLAFKVAAESPYLMNDNAYVRGARDLLQAQDVSLIIFDQTLRERSVQQEDKPIPANEIWTEVEKRKVLGGEVVTKKFTPPEVDSGSSYMAIGIPLTDKVSKDIVGALTLYQPLKSSDSLQLYVKRLFAFVSFIGFLLTTFFAFFLITRITRPIMQMRMAAGSIAQGEYSIRVPVVSSDELGELAKSFNLMGEQLEGTIKALNNEKQNLSSVLRSMSDAVISFDVEGKVIFTNPRGEKILKDWSEIQWNEPDPESADPMSNIPEPLQMLFNDVVEETKVVTSKIHVQHGVWSIVMAPLYSKKQVRGAVAVLRDVTEEHRLEKLRKDFVANVSHELRTPLSMLQGYSEALLDDIADSPEQRKELAQVILDESLRMGRLVKDLLDLARMEAGHMEMNMGNVELVPLFRRVHRKFSGLCKDRQINLQCQLPEEDELILQQADQDRLEQVLTNLLDNAIRHTPKNKNIYMRYEVLTHKDASAVLIEVEDEGKGIPPEDLPYIFERFYKADKARTRGSSGGTGLGLAIVKNIVEAHKGSVNVRSIVGQGTTFSIILPVSSQS